MWVMWRRADGWVCRTCEGGWSEWSGLLVHNVDHIIFLPYGLLPGRCQKICCLIHYFFSRYPTPTVKWGRRHRPGSGCVENSHGSPGVCKNCPFFSRPCPPFGRPHQMAEPVLSVATGPPTRSAPGASPAPAAGRVVSAKACDARRTGGSRPSSCRPAPVCSSRLILRRLFPQRRRRR